VNLFTIDDLKLELGGREVLDIPGLEISGNRFVAVTGPNGSGKTSLLQILGGLTRPKRGKVLYRDRDLFTQTPAARSEMRRDLGMVLQSPYLFKTTVLGNVCYGLRRRGLSRAAAAEKGLEALKLVGLGGFGKRPYRALSGGEAQRVVLARALVLEPKVLLLDEPFANVDAVSRSVIERVLMQENQYRKTSVIFTTHDQDQACRLGDIIVTLFDGKVHNGAMENLFNGRIMLKTLGAVFDTGRIEISIPRGRTRALAASIPPESILVSLSPVSTSARNNLHGRITAIREANGSVDVTVDVGETLMARITPGSYREMGLMLGGEVYLIFKAEAVRLY
jgi:molybdopterin-binding protein